MNNWTAIWDIADIYGKQIEETKLLNTVNVFMSNPNGVGPMIESLTQDERFVLVQYLNLYNTLQQNNMQQYQEMLNGLMMTSLAWSSQLIIFELK